MNRLTLEDSLLETMEKTCGYEILKEGSEIAIDIALKEGSLKGIPIVGAITTLVNGYIGVREYVLVKKLIRFITAVRSNSEEISKYIAALEEFPLDKRKLGERLFFVLDRLGDIEKCEYVARAFKALAHGDIKMDVFLRFLDVIDRCFFPDLVLLQNEKTLELFPVISLASLSSVGLLTMQAMISSKGNLSGYEISTLGELFIKHVLVK